MRFNVTMPHKQDILPFMDDLDKSASLPGSVNTVVVKGGKLTGFSTDAPGFERSLNAKGIKLKGQDILILGSGGVTYTLALHMAQRGIKNLCIANRTVEKAESISKLVAFKTGFTPSVQGLEEEGLKRRSASATLLINATPLGMEGCGDFESLSFLEALPHSAVVMDLIYNPSATKLLMQARSIGLTAFNGLGMLIHQGLLAFEHFTGIQTEDDDLLAVQKAIEENG